MKAFINQWHDRPLIGITKPDRKDNLAYACIWLSVILAGGRPKKIVPRRQQKLQAIALDGLVVGGGKDIFPGRYQGVAKDDYIYDEARDAMEIYWAERARAEDIPTLGICRGAQLLNIVCGGTLFTDVREVYKDKIYPEGPLHYIFYRKWIKLVLKNKLFEIVGQERVKVNSLHKQAIDKVGAGLQVSACEDGGSVQGIEDPDLKFFLGVQFHPEFLQYRADMRAIFRALVHAARARKGDTV